MTSTTPSLIVQPDAGLTPVIHAMRHAKRAIDVAIFRLTRRDVQDALGAAVARGIKVRALVAHKNGSNENRLRKLEQQLLASGVTVARTADEFVKYHGKFIVIDDTLHLLGFNLTKTDVTRTRSFGIRTRDRRAVQDAMALFESDLTRQPFSITHKSPLVVSPETARPALERLLSSARKRLAIYDGRLDDPVCTKIIRQRAATGVDVQIIGKAPSLALVEIAPFVDVGAVAARLPQISRAPFKISPGIGVRIRNDDRMFFRVDWARGSEGHRVLFSLSPAF